MTLTDAPKDFGGRLRLNCARTTPELPLPTLLAAFSFPTLFQQLTMWAGDLAPDNSNLRSSDLLAGTVNEGDLLSEVEAAKTSVSASAIT